MWSWLATGGERSSEAREGVVQGGRHKGPNNLLLMPSSGPHLDDTIAQSVELCDKGFNISVRSHRDLKSPE